MPKVVAQSLRRPWVAAAVAVALLITVRGPVAVADDEDQLRKKAQQIQAQIRAQANDVGATSRKVAAATADLTSARAELPAARSALVAAEAQLTAARVQDQAMAKALSAARAQQVKATHAVEAVQARIDANYLLIGRIARQAYTQGGEYGELSVALQAESPADFAGRISALDSIGRAEAVILGQLGVDEADLKISQRERDLAAAEVEKARLAAAAQLAHTSVLAENARAANAKVEALVAKAASALAVARANRAAELANLKALKAAQAKVRRQLAAASSGSGRPSGQLLWPANGPLTASVGPRIHPVYGYRSCHTGIDIGAGYGSTISAALSGTVIAEYFNTAYGNVTLIDHGDGLSTFYAHQSARLVGVGAHVSKGQPIGRVGATGFVTGPHLHFEVHINGTPYDPMGWFGGVKHRVVC